MTEVTDRQQFPQGEPLPPAPRQRSGRWLIVLLTVLAVAIAGGLGGALYGVNAHDSSVQAQLEHKISSLEGTITQQGNDLSGESNEMSSLSNQISKLNVPTDPLANYDEVCTIYADSALGNSLPWYLPCTTSAETIPQPG
jgi:hypothetical protein